MLTGATARITDHLEHPVEHIEHSTPIASWNATSVGVCEQPSLADQAVAAALKARVADEVVSTKNLARAERHMASTLKEYAKSKVDWPVLETDIEIRHTTRYTESRLCDSDVSVIVASVLVGTVELTIAMDRYDALLGRQPDGLYAVGWCLDCSRRIGEPVAIRIQRELGDLLLGRECVCGGRAVAA